VFSLTLESWVFLIIGCVISFSIGQWIRHRREKTEAEKEAYTKMLNTGQRKRVSKKERRKLSK
jgi:hypothetical protein